MGRRAWRDPKQRQVPGAGLAGWGSGAPKAWLTEGCAPGDVEGPRAPAEGLQRQGSGSSQGTERAAQKQDSFQEPNVQGRGLVVKTRFQRTGLKVGGDRAGLSHQQLHVLHVPLLRPVSMAPHKGKSFLRARMEMDLSGKPVAGAAPGAQRMLNK